MVRASILLQIIVLEPEEKMRLIETLIKFYIIQYLLNQLRVKEMKNI